jgi:hypothetical protein
MQVRGCVRSGRPRRARPAAERPAIALELDDLYLTEEPVKIHGKLVNVAESAGPLQARIDPVDALGAASLPALEFVEASDGWALELPELLRSGLYRIEVCKGRAVGAVAGA